jgi:hypothetical protein
MVESTTDPDDVFFACALAGTDGLSSIRYRTLSKKDGFLLSRDDYMNDVLNEGRQGYCRILKTGDTFEAKCHPAGDTSFSTTLVTDTSPPPAIQTLLLFYEGIAFWLRLDDDMVDYAQHLVIAKAGDIQIDETPRPPVTEGLTFNGIDQFLRIGDSKDLTLGQTVQLRYLRAITFWVYFEEFTNNAHVFDFGNGSGKDNVFVGIVGRGNAPASASLASLTSDQDQGQDQEKYGPAGTTGPTCTEEVSPQRAMATSSANVNRWDCPSSELFGRIMPPTQTGSKAAEPHEATTADLLYEIWDEKQRKQHIQVKNAIPLRKWVHIAITADDNDPWRPRLRIYRNGEEVHREEAGWLPQSNDTTHNYIGKSNWMSQTSPYANADELFKGRLFDFRGYRSGLSEKKVQAIYEWGVERLGITDEAEEVRGNALE